MQYEKQINEIQNKLNSGHGSSKMNCISEMKWFKPCVSLVLSIIILGIVQPKFMFNVISTNGKPVFKIKWNNLILAWLLLAGLIYFLWIRQK
jgi:hypothetical protein